LQQFVGVFKNVPELVAGGAQNFGRQLRRNLDARNRSVFCDESNFIDLDGRFSGQRGLQLLRQRTRLGVSAGKRANEPGELSLLEIGREVNTGDPGGCQQLRKTAFARCGTQRHAVQQNLVAGSSQQKSGVPALIEGLPQFLPGGLKLSRGSHVSKFVQARKLQQNVQASNEPACRRSSFLAHSSMQRPLLYLLPSYTRTQSRSKQASWLQL
jgi:hypothetical protein